MRNQIIVCLSTFMFLLICQSKVTAQTFIGVWRSGSGNQMAFPESDNWNYMVKVAKDRGYHRLSDLEINVIGKKELRAGVWDKASSVTLYRVGNWKQLVSDWKNLSKKGYRLTDIETYYQPANKERWYFGVFDKGDYGYSLWNGEGWSNFVVKWNELAKQNLRLVDIETYTQGGKRYYLGIWKAGKQGYNLLNLAGWGNFTKKWEELGKNNYRLIDLETYVQGGKRYYVGVWLYGTDRYYLLKVKGWANFNKKFFELRKKNFHLVDLEVIH